MFGKKGRAWLAEQPLPLDERCAVEQRLREIDRLSEDQRVIDRALAQANLHDARVHRLLTISGVNVTVAISLIAAIGQIERFAMLVEAAWAAAHTPGPLHAFFLRIRARRGMQIAAVAAARKLAIITWHVLTKNEDYDWVRPALTQKKMRALELQSGFKPTPGSNRGRAYEYNLAAVRASECAASEQAERAYERFVGTFKPKGPRPKSMADLRGGA